MKIVQLDIQGFRSLKSVTWRPGDLNVVIGPNGSGKSNLLRMLELISASAKGKLSNYVSAEGGMSAIVLDGESQTIQYHLDTSGLQKPNPEHGFNMRPSCSGLGAEARIMYGGSICRMIVTISI